MSTIITHLCVNSNEEAAPEGSDTSAALSKGPFGDYVAKLDVWLDSSGTPYATLPARLNVPVNSRDMREHLSAMHYRLERKTIGDRAIEGLLSSMAGTAALKGVRYPTHVRVASADDRLYLDLANERGQVVEITSAGWRIVDDCPVRFLRPKSMLPLPVPVAGGKIDPLWDCTNLPSASHQKLAIGWLLGTLMPGGPYPVLILNGQQGSAKTTTARVLRSVIDPSNAALRPPPSSDRDLTAMIAGTHIVSLDNVSQISAKWSDAFCRISSGIVIGSRRLYSDYDEALVSACRPLIVNGIPMLAHRGDLAERSIQLQLPRVDATERRTEAELHARFAQAHPQILGALLDATVLALAHKATIQLPELPRLADWAVWVTAGEAAFGWPQGSIVAAFNECQREATMDALTNDPVAQAIIRLVEEKGELEESPTRIHSMLREQADTGQGLDATVPRTVRGLSEALARLAPPLRLYGIEVERNRSAKTRTIRIRRISG